MVASGHAIPGCVTTGEAWQFLRLVDAVAELDTRRFYLDNVAGVLGALLAVIAEAQRHASPKTSPRAT